MNSIKSIRQNSMGVLFLRGVFKKDCKKLEDMFQDRLVSQQATEKIYNKIPGIFTTLDQWPEYTNLLCWFCHSSFKTRPWFEPQSIEPISIGPVGNIMNKEEVMTSKNRKSISIVTVGVFCTCNCVRAYIDKNTNSLAERINKVNMLRYVYGIFKGRQIPDIQPSPEPTCMVQYGGDIDQGQYRKMINKLDDEYINELEDNNFANICTTYLKKIME